MRVTCDRICRMVIAKPKPDYGCSFYPGEKARMRASVNLKLRVAGSACHKKKFYAPTPALSPNSVGGEGGTSTVSMKIRAA